MTRAMTSASAEERDGVAGWQDRLLGLVNRVAPAKPAPALWARIESGLGARPAAPPGAREPMPWWQRLGLWQGAAAFAAVACLVLAAMLLARPLPAGRSLRFWTEPEGAAGPTSLGLVRAGTALSVPAARLPALGEGQLFEITLEPEGGSTLGRPTGPILFVGKTVRL